MTMEDDVGDALASLRCGIDSLGAAELSQRLALLRRMQASIDGAIVLVARRADALAAAGHSGDAADMLRGHGQVRGRTARAEAKRARLLERVPDLGPPVADGAVSADHLDSLVRHLTPLSDDGLAALDVGDLAQQAARLPADTFDGALKRAVAASDPDQPRRNAVAQRAASTVRHWFDDDAGMGHVHAVLDPERYEAVSTALDQHTASLAAAGDDGGAALTRDDNLAAAAFVDLITATGPRRVGRAHVTIVVDGDGGRGQTAHGHELCADTVGRLRCDAVEQTVTTNGNGLPINVGRKYRTATDAQWTAIRALYAACAWEGCGRPLGWCQLHHLKPWSEGGPTDLDNLVPLCSHHHHQVHEGRWGIEFEPDRRLRITRPDGTHHATTAPPRRFSTGRVGVDRPPERQSA